MDNQACDQRKRILVIEDEPSIRHLLELFLGDEYSVHLAQNEAMAEKMINDHGPNPYALIVINPVIRQDNHHFTDITVGYQIIESVDKLRPRPHIIVTIATAYPPTLTRLSNLGADQIFIEPFNLDELKEYVDRLFQPPIHHQ